MNVLVLENRFEREISTLSQEGIPGIRFSALAGSP